MRRCRCDGVDAIVVLTALREPSLLEKVGEMDQVERYAGDVLTVPSSMAGLLAVSVPIVEGIGMQVIVQWGMRGGCGGLRICWRRWDEGGEAVTAGVRCGDSGVMRAVEIEVCMIRESINYRPMLCILYNLPFLGGEVFRG